MLFKKKEDRKIRVIDIHSHILPNLDDGSSSLKESLLMAKSAEENYITDIICTPHNKLGSNSLISDLEKAINNLQYQLDLYGIKVKLHLGSEVFFSSEYINDGRFIFLNNDRYMLLEYDPDISYKKLYESISDMNRSGHTPIIAHIERYECLKENYKLVEDIKSLDCLLQINFSSINKSDDRKLHKFINNTLKLEYIDFISTDAHNLTSRNTNIKKCCEYLYRNYDEEYIDKVLYKNALAYLGVKNERY